MNSVEQALNTPASEPISAESRPATTMPAQPGRQQVLHHHREGALRDRADRLAVGADHARPSSGILPLLARAKQIRPGDDEQVDREQLQERGEDAAAAGDRLVRRAQRALHDVLVGAPVPEADDRGADHHAEPGEVAVEVPGLARELARGVLLDDRRPGALDARRDHRLPQVEHVGAADAPQFAPAAQQVEAVDRQQRRARRSGRSPARRRCRPRRACRRAPCRGRSARSPAPSRSRKLSRCSGPRSSVQLRQQRAEHDAAGEDAHGDLGHDEGDERHDRQHVARVSLKAPLQELRHREDQRAHVERHEHPAPAPAGTRRAARSAPAPRRRWRPIPARPTMCSEPMFEAKIDAPMTHQPRLRPARK